MDFCTQLLGGPYLFTETIDSHAVDITLDLSAFFSDPPANLRELLPKYAWRDDGAWREAYLLSGYTNCWYNQTTFYVSGADDYSRMQAFIDSVVAEPWTPEDSIVYLNRSYTCRTDRDSSIIALPLDLVDDTGARLDPATIEELIDSSAFFPYFDDYTLHGLFPAMTRQRWLDLLWQ